MTLKDIEEDTINSIKTRPNKQLAKSNVSNH